MKSLVPQLKRLTIETKAFVKCQIQQLLFKAEFGKSFQEQQSFCIAVFVTNVKLYKLLGISYNLELSHCACIFSKTLFG